MNYNHPQQSHHRVAVKSWNCKEGDGEVATITIAREKNGEVTTFLKLISTFVICDPKNLFATPKIYFTYVVQSKNQRLPQDIEEKECKLQSRAQGTEQEYLSPQHILF